MAPSDWASFLIKTGTTGAGRLKIVQESVSGIKLHGTDGVSRFGEESATVSSIDADDVANSTGASSGHLIFLVRLFFR